MSNQPTKKGILIEDGPATDDLPPDPAAVAVEEPRPAPESLTPEQIAELQAAAAKAAEHWDRLLRTSADFENFKKRAARERQEAVRYANEGLLARLIPVLDNFEMALAAAQAAPDGSVDSLRQGIDMIFGQLRSALTELGLKEIDATGQRFDPNLHEAVSQQESREVPEGHVVQQLRKGYRLHDRLIRPASVVVAKAPAAPPAEQQAQ